MCNRNLAGLEAKLAADWGVRSITISYRYHALHILVIMDREILLAHLRNTRFAPADQDQAQMDARAIAAYLKREYNVRVIGIGSAFGNGRPFRQSSDIDLVVEGLPVAQFYQASARAADMTNLALDIIPLESATAPLLDRVRLEGVEL